MCGAHWNSGERGPKQSDCSCRFRTEPTKRFELSNFRTHGAHDPPSARVRAKCDGGMSGQNYGPVKVTPVSGDFGLAHITGRVQCAGHNSHGLLRVIATVAEAVRRSGEQL